MMDSNLSSNHWSSRISFIFAASAAAIGLGNIWRFPYMAGEHGGSAFVLIYLAFVLILGLPLLIAEIVLGKIGRKNPVRSIAQIATHSGRSRIWGWAGGLTILAGFLIMTYYAVIVGWVLDYMIRAMSAEFANATEATSLAAFTALQNSPLQMLFFTSVVVLGAIVINIFGIKKGLERAVMFMFPAMLVLMLLLLGYSITTGYFGDALTFLFKPEMHEVTANTFLEALGQAFFSLNIAMGVTITFSAYLPRNTPIISSAICIAIADTGFAILAGLIIFPVVFAYQVKASVGPSLIFQTLPIAFGRMPAGSLIGSLFFLMLFFAAFSSLIAVLEPAIGWMEETFGLGRVRSVIVVSVACWALSLGTIGSFSAKAHFQLFGITFFKALDFLTASIMLPIGGLLLAVFAGWLMMKKLTEQELGWNTRGFGYRVWQVSLRYIAPIAILFILLSSFGVL